MYNIRQCLCERRTKSWPEEEEEVKVASIQEMREGEGRKERQELRICGKKQH